MRFDPTADYSKLDQPEVLGVIFHPCRDSGGPSPVGALDHDIAVENGISLGARFYLAVAEAPHILFFHGNGETIGDHDEIGPMYNAVGLNFLAVDYRGYGRSSGTPTVSNMLADAHLVLAEVRQWMAAAGRPGPLLVMGRSLGCACALELAAAHEADLAGLIIESGFSETLPLLCNLGIDVERLDITEEDGFRNVGKIERINLPTLLLHAQNDQLIPVYSAALLQAQCGARTKELQIVPGAGHNDIIARTGRMYFEVIRGFVQKVCKTAAPPRRRYRSAR